MTTKEKGITEGTRIHFLDNLRTVVILLVVLFHTGGVYESSGVWGPFWLVDDPATNDIAGIINLMLDIFMMPVLFFISGYLAPISLEKRSAWSFLKSRFTRLIIPWAVAVLTLIPLYKVIFLFSRGLPQEHWTTYFHFSQGNPSSQSWLWFLPVLFVFNAVYVLLTTMDIRLPDPSLTTAVVGSTALALLYSLGAGYLLGFRSWTKTALIDFENERLLMYFLVFLLGALCFRKDVFAKKPQSKTLYTIANSVAWLPVTIHIFARLLPFMVPGGILISPFVDRLIWWLSFYLSVLAVVYILVQSFWTYLDSPGKLWRELSKNSYGVYVIHVIVIGVVGTLLLSVALPSIVKYLVLAVSAYVVSNVAVSAGRSLVRVVVSRRKNAQSQAADAV